MVLNPWFVRFTSDRQNRPAILLYFYSGYNNKILSRSKEVKNGHVNRINIDPSTATTRDLNQY